MVDVDKGDYYQEKLQKMNDEGHIDTLESLKGAHPKAGKHFKESASLLIVKYEDVQY